MRNRDDISVVREDIRYTCCDHHAYLFVFVICCRFISMYMCSSNRACSSKTTTKTTTTTTTWLKLHSSNPNNKTKRIDNWYSVFITRYKLVSSLSFIADYWACTCVVCPFRFTSTCGCDSMSQNAISNQSWDKHITVSILLHTLYTTHRPTYEIKVWIISAENCGGHIILRSKRLCSFDWFLIIIVLFVFAVICQYNIFVTKWSRHVLCLFFT